MQPRIGARTLRGEEHAAWVREHSPKAYEDALLLDAVVGAIERGDSVAEGEVDGLPVLPFLEFDNEVL